MSQFLLVAAAHFLALLSPGPDFFLIARTALVGGWRPATMVCIGVTIGNIVFITIAFAGSWLVRADSPLFITLQALGACYLAWLGAQFLRHAGSDGKGLSVSAAGTAPSPLSGLLLGLLSALSNPKNGLFYVSLVGTLGRSQGLGRDLFYAAWMATVVLLWDLLVVALIRRAAALRHFAVLLPWLERLAGAMLLSMAGLVVLLLSRG